MKTLESRIKNTLRAEAIRLPTPSTAKRTVRRAPAVTPQRRAIWVAVASFAIALLIFGPLGVIDPVPQASPAASPTATTTPPAPLTKETPSFSVDEIDRVMVPNDGTWVDPKMADGVAEVLASTGGTYEELPEDFVPDGATQAGRVVVVGGNSDQTARIWYSDGGPWMEAQIELPDGVTIGDQPGQHRLADGIGNVDVVGGRFVAWETAQPVLTAEDFDFPETLVLTSPDGSDWTARLVSGSFRSLVSWDGGALAVATHDWKYSNVLWTTDFEYWVEVADLGTVYVEAIEVGNGWIDVAVKEYSVGVSEETGETFYTDDGATSTVRLIPTG